MGGTWREGSSAGPDGGGVGSGVSGGRTWREGSGGVVPGGGHVLVGLVPCLVDRFVVVGQLPAGGESDVLVVEDAAGVRWVVKQYRRPGWAPSPDVLDLFDDLRIGKTAQSWAVDPVLQHLVFLADWGTDPASGLFFEVQEFLPGGTLVDGLTGRWDARTVVEAVIDAVSVFHRLVGAHRDLKPDNLLVRSTAPLVLTVADVGLARDVGEGSHRFSHRDGSVAYQAPEAAAGKVSRAGDWWAVGIIAAQAAVGHHPLALPDGSLPDNRVLLAAVAEHDVPLGAVSDHRLRLLCQGLLARDTQTRWRMAQITAWRGGENPATGYHTGKGVGADYSVESAAPPQRVRTVVFGAVEHAGPPLLAAAFAADPQRGGRVLFAGKDPVLLEDLRAMLRQAGLPEAVTVLDSYRSGAWEPTFLRLLAEMDPSLEPRLAGQEMTPAGIGQVAADVIGQGDATSDQRGVFTWVLNHDLWRIWRGLPGMDSAQVCANRLGELHRNKRSVRDALRRRLERSGQVSRQMVDHAYWLSVAWLIARSIDQQSTDSTLRSLLDTAAHDLPDQQWWLALSDESDLSRCFAAGTIGHAHTLQTELRRTQRAVAKQQAVARDAAQDAAFIRCRANNARANEHALAWYSHRCEELQKKLSSKTWWGGAKRRVQKDVLDRVRKARKTLQPYLIGDVGLDLMDVRAFADARDKDAFLQRALSWRPQQEDLRTPRKPGVWHELIAVTVGNDNTARVWDIMGGTPIGDPLRGHTSLTRSVAAATASDGRLIAVTVSVSGREDSTVRVWDVLAGTPVGGPHCGHTPGVNSVALATASDGRLIAVSGNWDSTVRVWDVLAGTPVGGPLIGHTHGVNPVAAATASDGRLIAVTVSVSGREDSTVRVWDVLAGTPVGGPLIGHTSGVTSVALATASDGRLIAVSGSKDFTVRVWDVLAGTPVGGPLIGHTSGVTSVALATASDGRLIAVSGSKDFTVRVWDVLAGTPVGGPLIGHTHGVQSVALATAPDGRLIAVSGSMDSTVRVWDALAGTPIGDPLTGHTGYVHSVSLATHRWEW